MSSDPERQPLIEREGLRRIPTINLKAWLYPDLREIHSGGKVRCQRFLSSKYGHYSVLLLVSLDVSCIFADFIINLFVCEGHIDSNVADVVLEVLDWSGLTFSSLFIIELLASIWAFGTDYFGSYFHCFDAFIIIFGFVLDVYLKGGPIEEAASLIVILRLWRVFKIIEELSVGAQEQVEQMEVRINELEKEVATLRKRTVNTSAQPEAENPPS